MPQWTCGAKKCHQTHRHHDTYCHNGVWYCLRLEPACPGHTLPTDQCNGGTEWTCGAKNCQGHPQAGDKCSGGKWYCDRRIPACPGHTRRGELCEWNLKAAVSEGLTKTDLPQWEKGAWIAIGGGSVKGAFGIGAEAAFLPMFNVADPTRWMPVFVGGLSAGLQAGLEASYVIGIATGIFEPAQLNGHDLSGWGGSVPMMDQLKFASKATKALQKWNDGRWKSADEFFKAMLRLVEVLKKNEARKKQKEHTEMVEKVFEFFAKNLFGEKPDGSESVMVNPLKKNFQLMNVASVGSVTGVFYEWKTVVTGSSEMWREAKPQWKIREQRGKHYLMMERMPVPDDTRLRIQLYDIDYHTNDVKVLYNGRTNYARGGKTYNVREVGGDDHKKSFWGANSAYQREDVGLTVEGVSHRGKLYALNRGGSRSFREGIPLVKPIRDRGGEYFLELGLEVHVLDQVKLYGSPCVLAWRSGGHTRPHYSVGFHSDGKQRDKIKYAWNERGKTYQGRGN